MKAKNKKQVKLENTFIPLPPSINACINFWAKKSLRGELKEVSSNFNLELYLAYLNAIK